MCTAVTQAWYAESESGSGAPQNAKIAVFSAQQGVDPVGSCVGQKGVRVQAVTNEIGGERVDVSPWNDDPAELIKSSLSPAEGLEV